MQTITSRLLISLVVVSSFATPALAEEGGFEVRKASRQYSDPYASRPNDLRLSLFGGAIFSSRRHQLFDRQSSSFQRFRNTNAQLGVRLGYSATSYFGAEIEGTYSPAASEDEGSADVIAPRAHAMLQMPGRFAPFIVAGAGLRVIRSGDEVLGDDIDPAAHWGLGARFQITERISARIDGRHIIGPAQDTRPLAHDFEMLGSLGMRWGLGENVNPDLDGDGLANNLDECPELKGDGPDGCPLDEDRDGFADASDQCPGIPGAAEWNGCPDPDSDRDGIAMADDLCPDVAGVAPNGCPDEDTDRDGVLAANDLCPNEPETRNGFQDADGCPDTVPEEVAQFQGALEGITFKTGSAEIAPSSFVNLDKVLAVLKKYDRLQVEIGGHTDSTGSERTNAAISQRRAEAVMQYLLQKGVPAERVAARGYGEAKPVAPNDTRTGRKQNRRIEFTLVQ